MKVKDLISKLEKMNPDQDIVDPTMGVMEIPATLGQVIAELIKCHNGTQFHEQKLELKVSVVEKSKHHNGKPVLIVHEQEPDDISIFHIEISEDGIVPYIFDDGVS